MKIVQSKMRITEWMLGEYRRPLTDVVMRDSETIISLELPGVLKENIVVQCTPDGVEVWARLAMGTVLLHSGYYKFIPLQQHSMERLTAAFDGKVLELRIPLEVEHACISPA